MKKALVYLVACFTSIIMFGCSTNTIHETQIINNNHESTQPGYRQGTAPETTDAPAGTTIAHQQITQQSPIELQEQLRSYMSSLTGVVTGATKISVAGAKGLFVPGTTGPTLAGDEWAHLHPSYDGSLHIALDTKTMKTLVETGWGEFHPRNNNAIMLYGPKNEEELSYIKNILQEGLKLHTIPERNSQIKEKPKPLPFSVEALQEITFSGHSLSLESIEQSNSTYTRYRIFYTSNGYRISGILNIPQGVGPFPLVILNHGYIDPAVYTVGRGLKREQDYLARQGFAVLHTDYRNHGLSDKDTTLNENYMFRNYFYTQDSINAIFAVKNSNLPETNTIDTDRIGMLGHSMGGGVTMHALITQPQLIDAAILYAPVHSSEWYNFDRWRSSDLNEAQKREREDRLGALNIENFMPYSATPYAKNIQSAVQIYFGTNDESVPYQRGVDIQEILTQAGVDSELITYTGEKHEFIREWNAFMEGTVSFLNNQFVQ